MREIKFKSLIEDVNGNIYWQYYGVDNKPKYADMFYGGWIKEPIVEDLQFVGLHDKHGKEIYDSDIIKVGTKHGFNSNLLNEFKDRNNLDSINGICSHFTGIIRIDFLRGLMFENMKNGYQEPMFTRHIDIKKNHSDIEIIGNLHEHGHLLSK